MLHVLWCETVLQLLKHYLLETSRLIHYNRFVLRWIFKERMTAIAIAKGASTKSCVLSQERFDAIDRPPSIVPTRQS